MNKWISAVTLAAVLLTAEKGCDLNPPGDKMPAGGAPAIVEIMMEVTFAGTAPETWANVKVNVRDHSGLPSVDIPSGEIYPTEHPRRLPYKHWVIHLPHVTATYSIEAYVGGVPGDILGCAIYIDGVKLQEIGTPHVVEIEEGGQSALVYCEFTRYGVKS